VWNCQPKKLSLFFINLMICHVRNIKSEEKNTQCICSVTHCWDGHHVCCYLMSERNQNSGHCPELWLHLLRFLVCFNVTI
jgi:hypothetical protein